MSKSEHFSEFAPAETKVKGVAVVLVALVLLCAAFIAVDHVIGRLGMRHQSAQMYILNNLVEDFSLPGEDVGAVQVNGVKGQSRAFRIPALRAS